ncbi:MAG: hypothetical protein ACOYD1_07760 [Candidatus Nanopelagicales bacterium]
MAKGRIKLSDINWLNITSLLFSAVAVIVAIYGFVTDQFSTLPFVILAAAAVCAYIAKE